MIERDGGIFRWLADGFLTGLASETVTMAPIFLARKLFGDRLSPRKFAGIDDAQRLHREIISVRCATKNPSTKRRGNFFMSTFLLLVEKVQHVVDKFSCRRFGYDGAFFVGGNFGAK